MGLLPEQWLGDPTTRRRAGQWQKWARGKRIRRRDPQLRIEGVPEGTRSLTLIVDDPDAPAGTWVHWVLFNIAPETEVIEQNSKTGTVGINDFHKEAYGGPCPPRGTHRYFFKLYALDDRLPLESGVSKGAVEAAMSGNILEQAELIGLYKRR